MKRLLNALAMVVYVWGFLTAAAAGEVHGHILITKILTKKRMALPDYQMRGVPAPPPPEEAARIDEFSRTVIYMDEIPSSSQKPVTEKLIQRNRQFVPEILVIPVGSTVSFPNEDQIFHNVFSLSKTKQFDLGYYPAGQTRNVEFDKVGVVQVYCHIHRDMNAAILVVPNRWHTQPGDDGVFTLSGIPAGKHTVVVWHKSVGFFKKSVVVPDTGSIEVSFTIPIRTAD